MKGHWPTGFRVLLPAGPDRHQIRLHFLPGSLRSAVDCTCGARAGIVTTTSGTEPALALHRAHVAAVTAERVS